jgi:hypothetical protein
MIGAIFAEMNEVLYYYVCIKCCKYCIFININISSVKHQYLRSLEVVSRNDKFLLQLHSLLQIHMCKHYAFVHGLVYLLEVAMKGDQKAPEAFNSARVSGLAEIT